MKIVYRATNLPEADIVAGLLRSRGIDAEVGGRYLQTAVGAATGHDFALLMVIDEHYEEALAIVAEYESASQVSGSSNDKSHSFAALGLFSKPVLFWLSLVLLIISLLVGLPVFQL